MYQGVPIKNRFSVNYLSIHAINRDFIQIYPGQILNDRKKAHQMITWSSAIFAFIKGFGDKMFRYIPIYWVPSGDFMQSQWEKVLEFFGHNQFNLNVYGSILILWIVFFAAGALYTILDVTGRPAFLLKYKIQDPNSEYPISFKKLKKLLKQVFVNKLIEILITPLVHFLAVWRGCEWRELPTFQSAVLSLIGFALIEEFGFYYSHRLLHNPLLYKHIHKRHHEWQTPIAFSSIYCHPFEHIFCNLMPFLLGPLIMGSHTAVIWIWFTMALLTTLSNHSGYHFPFMGSPEFHDYHHLKFNQNFGTNELGLLDRLHGTDSMFRKSKACKRHKTLLSVVPIKQLYPD